MQKTTLKAIRAFSPCSGGWRTLTRSLNPDGLDLDLETEITYLQILESNGLEDAIWSLRTAPLLAVEFSTACAERGFGIFEAKYPDDSRPRKAVEAAKNYLECSNTAAAARAEAAELEFQKAEFIRIVSR